MAIKWGSRGHDALTGTSRDDLIFGLAGNDMLNGRAGNDILWGGLGSDTLIGGLGNDLLVGGSGFDTAVMSGAFRDSSISFPWFDVVVDGPDGRDHLLQMEAIEFDDGTVYLDGRNNDPFAYADEASVDAGHIVEVSAAAGLLANDQDVEDDVLVVTGIEGAATSVGVEIALASGALLTANADGSFSYDTSSAFAGLGEGETATDTFSYTISDGHGGTDTAMVTVTVAGTSTVNHAPQATEDQPVASATEDGGPVIVNYNVDDIDADDDRTTLIYSFGAQSSGSGFAFDNGDGSFTFNPANDFQDLAEGELRNKIVSFTATDSHGASADFSQMVEITGVNDAPSTTLTALLVFTMEDGPSVTANLSVRDIDSDDNRSTLSYVFVPLAAGLGSVTDNGGGSFTYDPGSDFQGLADGEFQNFSFSYTATDSHGASSTLTQHITVAGVNDAPDAVDDSVAADLYTATVFDVLTNDSDIDARDVLSVLSVDATSAAGVALTVNADGTIGYDPAGFFSLGVGATATDTFSYTVTDGHSGTDTATVTVTLSNDYEDYNLVLGTPQSETLDGTTGNDRIVGLDGGDFMKADAGNDILLGGRGNDVLQGGTGSDTMTGGADADIFLFNVGYGQDTVTDFNFGEGDRINLGNFGADFVTLDNNGDAILDALDDNFSGGTGPGDPLVIDMGGGDQLILIGVASLGMADITFGAL